MDKLPVELLQRMAEHLNSSTSKEGISAIASFSRTSKQHYQALTPMLYRDVNLETREEAFLWARTSFGRVPFRCLPSGPERAWAEKITVRSLSFSRVDAPYRRLCSKVGTIPTFLAHVDVPDLRPGLACGTFSSLTSLSLCNFSIHPHVLVELLGPFKPLRVQLEKLELDSIDGYGHFTHGPVGPFLLQALDYLDPPIYGKAVVKCQELFERDPDFECRQMNALDWTTPTCTYTTTVPSHEQIRRASYDYPSFLAIFKERSHVVPATLHAMIHKSPSSPTLSPCASLVSLTFQRDGMGLEELYLVFYTPLLPSLKRLSILDGGGVLWSFDNPLISTFRRSISHHPPGSISPPCPERGLEEEAAKYKWEPLSQAELAAYPFEPYQGPLLEHLDLSSWMFPTS